MIEIKNIGFSTKIDHTAVDKRMFRLDYNHTCSWETDTQSYVLTAPKGFLWDGATIPRALWSLAGYHPSGLMLAPSMWHDYIYVNKGKFINQSTNEEVYISRKHSDVLFYRHMILAGIEPKKAKLFYQIVRLAGRVYWND
jgi:hypothetical protein